MLVSICALLTLAALAAGCSQGGAAQEASATATAIPAATEAASPIPSGTPAAQATPAGTNTPRPIPTGTPPEPLNVLNIFNFYPSIDTLVKRDLLQLDEDDTPEVLFTITEPGDTITEEHTSAIRVLDYDPTYREWRVAWLSEAMPGKASPLPAVNRTGGVPTSFEYNGGDLLRTGSPVLLMRTTTLDGRAHLYMWRWDASTLEAQPVKMIPAIGQAEVNADFAADLDVKVADVDADGVYEVVADDLAGTKQWEWNGSAFQPEVQR
jgi:hypothetical protein